MGKIVRTQIGRAHLLVLSLLVVGPWASVEAQIGGTGPRYTPDVLTSSSLSSAQQGKITDYCQHYVNELRSASTDARVADARRMLSEPMANPLASIPFKAAHSNKTAELIKPLVTHKDPVVRMNAMIVVASLRSSMVTELVISGLSDQDKKLGKAIRYWAAKAVAETGEGAAPGEEVFGAGDQKLLIKALNTAMQKEDSDHVLEQMFAALGALSIPEAIAQQLKILTSRLDIHKRKIDQGLRADQRGMFNLYRRITIDEALEQDITKRIRDLSIVAAKYLQVVAEKLQKKQVPDEHKPIARDMIEICEKILDMALKVHDPGFSGIKPPLVQPYDNGNTVELLLNAQQWTGSDASEGILQKSKLNIPYKDVKP